MDVLVFVFDIGFANLSQNRAFLRVAIFKGRVKTVLNGLFGICIRYKLCHMHVIMHSGDKFE